MTVVGHDEWLQARRDLLAREKEFTRARDELSRARQALPWEPVEREYVFEGPHGKQTLAELFDGRSQLLVYHFMFDPADDVGCPICSFWADNFDPIVIHLAARDVTMLAISRAPVAKLERYRQRMAGASSGSPPATTASPMTSESRSRRTSSTGRSTTTARSRRATQTARASASSPRTPRVASSTRIRRTLAASTW